LLPGSPSIALESTSCEENKHDAEDGTESHGAGGMGGMIPTGEKKTKEMENREITLTATGTMERPTL